MLITSPTAKPPRYQHCAKIRRPSAPINLSKYYTESPNEDTQLAKLDEDYRFMEIEVQKNIDHLKELESEIISIKESCSKSEEKCIVLFT